MTELTQVYKCEICGNIVEMVHPGKGQMVCCGQPMKLMKENTVDASKEKHVPVVENNMNVVHVKVGAVPHPMEEKHYIEWIEMIAGGVVKRKHLMPGDRPDVEFVALPGNLEIRAYCNLHGLWKCNVLNSFPPLI